MNVQFSIRHIAGVTIFDLRGRLVASEEGESLYAALIQSAEDGHRWILVNCAGLTLVDSAGLGDIVAAHAAVIRRGGVVRLLQPTPRLRELLALTRLDSLLEVFVDEPAALTSFNALSNVRTQQKLSQYLKEEH